jgi:outer membrane protein assembly factor BamD (BamD/ComL family)
MSATIALLFVLSSAYADTWLLGQNQDWQEVSADGKDKFLMAVVEAKKLVNSGQSEAAHEAYENLKKDFPEITGSDLDDFIEAEMLFCKGKLRKAADAYDKLYTEYPQSKLRQAALDRQFSIGIAYLTGQKKSLLGVFKVRGFADGVKIMKRIIEHAGDTSIGIEAAVTLGQKHEERGELITAYRIYEKLLTEHPDNDYREQILNREFAIATAYLGGQRRQFLRVVKIKGHAYGVKIMEKITDRAGIDSPIGLEAALAVAEHYEKRKKYNQAYLKWWEISLQWQRGKTGRDALLGMARCKHAAYNLYPENKRAFYDVSNLNMAKSCYDKFKLLYPKDAEEMDVDTILTEIDEQLANSQLNIGQYYYKTDNIQSANLYFNMVISDWPNTKAAKTAKEMLTVNPTNN